MSASAAGVEAVGQLHEEVARLTAANRQRRDHALERRLIRLRHEAFLRGPRPTPVAWPAVTPADPPPGPGLPAITPRELSAEVLAGGIARHGCLHVRGLVPPATVDRLVDGIDRAFRSHDAQTAGDDPGEDAAWYVPFTPDSRYKIGYKRRWVRQGGGVWGADAPPALFDLLETVHDVGLGDVITRYLGERPALSANKCTLRRVPLDTSTDWHQDGSFLGQGIRTVNVWLSLSHCGDDAPGLDLVPRRFDHVVETGTDGAMFDWATGPGVVEQVRGDVPVVRPRFAPGDVLLFDELFLHRTAIDAAMTRERYAIETWFFAPSVYPDRQIPLAY